MTDLEKELGIAILGILAVFIYTLIVFFKKRNTIKQIQFLIGRAKIEESEEELNALLEEILQRREEVRPIRIYDYEYNTTWFDFDNQILLLFFKNEVLSCPTAFEKAPLLFQKMRIRSARWLLLWAVEHSTEIELLCGIYSVTFLLAVGFREFFSTVEILAYQRILKYAKKNEDKLKVYLRAPLGSKLKRRFAPKTNPPQKNIVEPAHA